MSQSEHRPYFAGHLGFGVLLLTVIGTLVHRQQDLKVARPPEITSATARPTEEGIPARLWQDPWEAVCRWSQQKEAGQIPRPQRDDAVLLVSFPGGDSFEDHESRIRNRYAVLMALGVAGYIPDKIDRIHAWRPRLRMRPRSETEPLVIPHERFFHPDGAGRGDLPAAVWVLWLNDQRLESELQSNIKLLVLALYSGKPTGQISWLGPSWSDTLSKVAPDLAGLPKQLKIYSWSATAPDSAVRLAEGQSNRLFRTIATDEVLAERLARELRHRGVELTRGRVVLLSEWATTYGRTLPLLVKKELGRGAEKLIDSRLLRMAYLRGLDGITFEGTDGRRPDGNPATRPAPDGSKKKSEADKQSVERAEGHRQIDYVRRLAARIQEQSQWRFSKDDEDGSLAPIVAFGILGTDV